MKFGITGVAGLLGSNIAKHLISKGHSVVGIDNFSCGFPENLPESDSFSWYRMDVSKTGNVSSMKDAFSGCEAVYHAAAHAHEGLSFWSPSSIVNSVVGGTVAVATACVQAGVNRMVNFSSMSRYGNSENEAIETTSVKPVDPYALAKIQAEKQAEMIGNIHGLEVVHAVPHMCIGVGQVYNDPFRNICGIAINRILQGKPIIVYGDGSQRRCFSSVRGDLVAYEGIATRKFKKQGELYHMGIVSKEMSIREVAEFICDTMCVPYSRIEHVESRHGDLRRSLCSSKKIRKLYGQGDHTLEDCLMEQIGWQMMMGPKDFNYYINLEIQNEKTPKTWTQKKI